MSCLDFWLYHNVIYIIFHFLVHHIMEDGCHGSLVCGSCIFKAKGHHNVIKVSNRGLERCLFCIFGSHLNLVIPIISIHKRKHGVSRSWIYKEINIRWGNSSFGYAFFRLWKSTQHRIWPFFFFTGTMLDSHLGCWIGLLNPATSDFLTSWVIWAFTSLWKTLASWTTGLTLESTLRE